MKKIISLVLVSALVFSMSLTAAFADIAGATAQPTIYVIKVSAHDLKVTSIEKKIINDYGTFLQNKLKAAQPSEYETILAAELKKSQGEIDELFDKKLSSVASKNVSNMRISKEKIIQRNGTVKLEMDQDALIGNTYTYPISEQASIEISPNGVALEIVGSRPVSISANNTKAINVTKATTGYAEKTLYRGGNKKARINMSANFYYNNVKAWYKDSLKGNTTVFHEDWRERINTLAVHQSYYSSTDKSHWAWADAKFDHYDRLWAGMQYVIVETVFLFAGVICDKNGNCTQAIEQAV